MVSQTVRFLSLDIARVADVAWCVREAEHDVRYANAAESDWVPGDGVDPKTDDWRVDGAPSGIFGVFTGEQSVEGFTIEPACRGVSTDSPTSTAPRTEPTAA